MKFAYADPPYEGQAKKHYGAHDDFDGEVDQHALVDQLILDFPDGWALSLSCKSLANILSYCTSDVRVMAWPKPATPVLPGIRLQYGWEPVILSGGRQGRLIKGEPMHRDYIITSPEGYTFRPRNDGHVIGRKPYFFSYWIFNSLGMQEDDEFVDLFPGTGAVLAAWDAWRRLGCPMLRQKVKVEYELVPREVMVST